MNQNPAWTRVAGDGGRGERGRWRVWSATQLLPRVPCPHPGGDVGKTEAFFPQVSRKRVFVDRCPRGTQRGVQGREAEGPELAARDLLQRVAGGTRPVPALRPLSGSRC